MYGKAMREVNEVLENMDEEYTSKISLKFINNMLENIDWTYDFKYDTSKSLEEQNLSEEAKIILSMIYMKYFCNETERLEIVKTMQENDKKFEELAKDKYNPEKIFENEENIVDNDKKIEYSKEELPIVSKKWYQKILEKLKSFFKK